MEGFSTSTSRAPAQPFQVNTKGLCFFCLKPATVRSPNSRLPMKMLLRYLKIDVYNLCNFSSYFLEFIGAIDEAQVEVEVCHSCDLNINRFAALYKEMEMVRMQLDNSLKNVYDAVQESQNLRRLNEYRRRLHSQNVLEMFGANFAENLRAETKRKCFQKMKNMVPRFNVKEEEVASVLSSQVKRRKPPGPKSKTDPESSRLKALLEMGPTPTPLYNQPQPKTFKSARLQSRESRRNNWTSLSANGALHGNGREDAIDTFSEHFMVKLEPSISLVEEDDQSNSKEDLFFGSYVSDAAPATREQKGGTKNEITDFSESNKGIMNGVGLGVKSENTEPYYDDHGNGTFSCKQCGKVFDKLTRLRGHLAIHKGDGGPRPIFPTRKQKMKLNKRSKRYQCKKCRRFFYSLNNYKFHLKSHASGDSGLAGKKKEPSSSGGGSNLGDSESKKYPCSNCDSIFNSSKILSTHRRTKHPLAALGHHMPPGTSEDELHVAIAHAVGNHARDDQKRYMCGYCDSVYPHPSHLKLHISIKHVDALVEIVLRNKAINSGADGDIQFEDISMDGAVDVQIEHEEESLLYEGDENPNEDAGGDDQGDLIHHDHEQHQFHDEYVQEVVVNGEGEAYEIDADGNANPEEMGEESSISISEPFSLSNGV